MNKTDTANPRYSLRTGHEQKVLDLGWLINHPPFQKPNCDGSDNLDLDFVIEDTDAGQRLKILHVRVNNECIYKSPVQNEAASVHSVDLLIWGLFLSKALGPNSPYGDDCQ